MAGIVARNGNELTLQVTVKLPGSLMEIENIILDGGNEIESLATQDALQRFDTDGVPIKLGDTKMTARHKNNKTYQSPYGSIYVERYLYKPQKAAGFIALWNIMLASLEERHLNLRNKYLTNIPI